LSHACLLPSRVTGLGPVTTLGWLGPAQPMLVGLDPTPKKRKEKKKREWVRSRL